MFTNWLRWPAGSRPKAPARPQSKPTLEVLEDRIVPIAVNAIPTNLIAQTLANELTGSGVLIGGYSYTGSPIAAGTFTNGNNEVGMASGIILDTGSIGTIAQRNPALPINPGTNLGQAGDPAISALLGGLQTFDAASLNFVLISQGPQVSMSFVYASNEFNGVMVENDTFIATVNGTNVATLPSGALVNPVGIAGSPGIIRDNIPFGMPYGPLAIMFNGITDVQTITFKTTPGVPYYIHLSIADTNTPLVDSAVFIEAHSVGTPARLTAAFPTSWIYNRTLNTYVGYITIYNLGPTAAVGTLNVSLNDLPSGVSVAPVSPGWFGNTYTNTVAFGRGQAIRIAVQLSDPYHVPLPTYFNLASTIGVTLS